MITFYYIEGIDRENLPYFEQGGFPSEYMQERIVAQINDTYYPPYYRNVISVLNSDFEKGLLNSEINYLSLYSNEKEYYYFIDEIEYVNEDITKLHITMDVIMTFMPNIKIHSGIIERKFINRWDGIYINRNYIRENFSKGLFQLIDRKYLNERKYYDNPPDDDDSLGLFVIRCTDTPWKPESDFLKNSVASSMYKDGVECYARYATYIIPYVKNSFSSIYQFNNSKKYDTYLFNTLYNSTDVPSIVDCRYYPINIFNNYIKAKITTPQSSGTTGVINVICSDADNRVCTNSDDTPNKQAVLYLAGTMTIEPIKGTYIFTWSRTGAKLQLFNSAFVPALIDENYMRLSYGDGEVQATAQLYYIKDTSITYNYKYDINSGSRYYWFDGITTISKTNDVVYGNNNILSSLVVNENACTFDLVSDSWKTWKAYNSATLPLTLGKTVLDVASFALGGSMLSNSMDTLFDTKGFIDRRYKAPTLNKAGSRKMYELQNKENSYLLNGIFDLAKMPSRYENIMNASAAPATLKSGGIATSALFSEGMNIRLDIYKVNDFEQCAQYYHRYGYLVDEYVSGIDDIFQYVNTRYYYNVLKMREIDISLVNYPSSNDILELIRERLENGIRLWNVTQYTTNARYIGDYEYDNIENDYLK